MCVSIICVCCSLGEKYICIYMYIYVKHGKAQIQTIKIYAEMLADK